MIRAADDARTDAADRNVLGGELQTCSVDPVTGYYRDGCCRSGADDLGVHSVCCLLTEEFLEFSLVSLGLDEPLYSDSWAVMVQYRFLKAVNVAFYYDGRQVTSCARTARALHLHCTSRRLDAAGEVSNVVVAPAKSHASR